MAETESYFINPSNRKCIDTIYSEKNIKINCNFNECEMQIEDNYFNIIIERMNANNLLQVRLYNLNDLTKIYVSTIDNNEFERIKIEQSLHVSFEGFVNHLTKILDSCKRGQLQMTLVKDQDHQILKFYEYRSFRNLIHLYIIITEAPLKIILYYLNQSLSEYKQQIQTYALQKHTFENQLTYKENNIIELQNEVSKLQCEIQEQEKLVFSRYTEQISKLQQEIKHITEKRNNEVARQSCTIANLQDRIDQLAKDNNVLNERQVTKSRDKIRDDNTALKSNCVQFKESNDELQSDILHHKSKMEHLLSEGRIQISNLEHKCKQYEKQKSELTAIIEAEKHICNTKRYALQLATDDITKANTIIVKQSKEIIQLKKKINLRTEVALQQEKSIERLYKENISLKAETLTIQNSDVAKLTQRQIYSNSLQSLQNTADEIENKYANKIDELTNKVTQLTLEKTLNENTNRYLKLSNGKLN